MISNLNYGKSYEYTFKPSNSLAWQLLSFSFSCGTSYSLSVGTTTKTNLNILDGSIKFNANYSSAVNLSANIIISDKILNSEGFVNTNIAIEPPASVIENAQNVDLQNKGYDKLRNYLCSFGDHFVFTEKAETNTSETNTTTCEMSYYDSVITNYNSYQNYQNNFIMHSDANITLTDASDVFPRARIAFLPFLIPGAISAGLSLFPYFESSSKMSFSDKAEKEKLLDKSTSQDINVRVNKDLWVRFDSTHKDYEITKNEDCLITLDISDAKLKKTTFYQTDDALYDQYELFGKLILKKDGKEIAHVNTSIQNTDDLNIELTNKLLTLKIKSGDELSTCEGECKTLDCKDFLWKDNDGASFTAEFELIINEINKGQEQDSKLQLVLTSPFTRNEKIAIDDKYKDILTIKSIENNIYYGEKAVQNIGKTVDYTETSESYSCKFMFPIRTISNQKALKYFNDAYYLYDIFDLISEQATREENTYIVPVVDFINNETTTNKTLNVVELKNGEVSIEQEEHSLNLQLSLIKPQNKNSAVKCKLSLGQSVTNDGDELTFAEGTSSLSSDNIESILNTTLFICSKNIKLKSFGGYTYKYIFFKIYYDAVGRFIFKEIPVFSSTDLTNLLEDLGKDVIKNMLPLNILSTVAPIASTGVGAAAAGLFGLFANSKNKTGLLIDTTSSEARKGSIFSLSKKCLHISSKVETGGSTLDLSKDQNNEASLSVSAPYVSCAVGNNKSDNNSLVNIIIEKDRIKLMNSSKSCVEINSSEIKIAVGSVNFNVSSSDEYTYSIGEEDGKIKGKITKDSISNGGITYSKSN